MILTGRISDLLRPWFAPVADVKLVEEIFYAINKMKPTYTLYRWSVRNCFIHRLHCINGQNRETNSSYGDAAACWARLNRKCHCE